MKRPLWYARANNCIISMPRRHGTPGFRISPANRNASILAIFLSFLAGIARVSRFWIVRYIAFIYVEVFRGVALVVQLFWLFFVLPFFGLNLNPFTTAIIGLGLHYSCYTAEAYRAGLESVPMGQWDAALALNYNRLNTLRRIILPQAIPPIIPAMGNYLVAMFKDTPILAAINLVEMMYTASIIGSEKFLYVEPMTIVGLLFLDAGRIEEQGPPEQILVNPQNERTRMFLKNVLEA